MEGGASRDIPWAKAWSERGEVVGDGVAAEGVRRREPGGLFVFWS